MCVRYVIDDRSPFRRMARQNGPSSQKAGKAQAAVINVDDDDNGWSFSSFVKKDTIKDSIPDQQLSVQELTLRYPGKEVILVQFFTDTFLFYFESVTADCC